MTVHVVYADPQELRDPFPALVGDGYLDRKAAQLLAEAMLQDTTAAVAESGGDLVVTHPPESNEDQSDEPRERLREVLSGALPGMDAVQFESQVGDRPTERVENACRHIVSRADVASVAVLDGRAPLLDRTDLDNAGMKLRRSEVVVGPAPAGRVAYLGMTEPIELSRLHWPLALGALVDRAVTNGHTVDWLPLQVWVGGRSGLETLTTLIRADQTASRRVPERTAAAIDAVGL